MPEKCVCDMIMHCVCERERDSVLGCVCCGMPMVTCIHAYR
jgi:hypothetical protein